jgi:hypothetical protein
MKFDENPNYDDLRGLFAGLMKSQGLVNDNEFDWFNSGSGSGNSNHQKFNAIKAN